jgi:hypothetical protein
LLAVFVAAFLAVAIIMLLEIERPPI